MASAINFLKLPADTQLVIFSFLEGENLAQISRVCKVFNTLAKNDQLWKLNVKTRFQGIFTIEEPIENWKEKYVQFWEYLHEREKEYKLERQRTGSYNPVSGYLTFEEPPYPWN